MEDSKEKSSKLAKFLVVFFPFLVGFTKHQTGFVLGWSAILPKMQADNSTSFDVSDEDVKWLLSVTGIAGMAGTLVTGPIIETFGPTRVIVWIQLPSIILWLVSAYTPYLSLLYLGRIGLSLILIITGPLIPLLISELSDPTIRGSMLASEEIMVSFGLLVMYVMAQELYWSTAVAVGAVTTTVVFVLCFFLPESPFWLARNGQYERAKTSLLSVRFSQEKATEEMKTLIASVEATKQSTVLDQIRQLKHCRNYRPVLLLVAIYVLRELGGEYTIFNYTVYMFEKAKVNIDPFMCTVLVGATRTIASIASAILVDRLGRRPLLIGTSLLCAAASLLCGVFLLLDLPEASWVPLVALLVYVASYGFGLGPIPWGLTGEMIPTPVRSIGGSICIFWYSLSVFAMSYMFPEMIALMGLGPTFLSFSVFLVALSIIIFCCFPETKSRTLNDLEVAFKRKSKRQKEVFNISSNIEESVQGDTGCETSHF
ncbi:facilitated trehalose transporter Tret1-like [Palaemon carinicauda]|uniref:facilitated trehalose transporter Tret1-like n=1 Tax=Palaemon carinicauda TaxID=392227 RepID=UPI0035B5ED7E